MYNVAAMVYTVWFRYSTEDLMLLYNLITIQLLYKCACYYKINIGLYPAFIKYITCGYVQLWDLHFLKTQSVSHKQLLVFKI